MAHSQKNRRGVILAAGASSRMGSPKALLQFHDGTLLADAQRRLLLESGCGEVVTVIGSHASEIQKRLSGTMVINPHWERGRLSSVQAGLQSSSSCDAFILLPVDAVGIQPSTIRALLEHKSSQPFTRPVFQGTPGHVLKISPEGRDILLSLSSSDDLNMGSHIQPLTELCDCNDPMILTNVNTSEEWAQWTHENNT